MGTPCGARAGIVRVPHGNLQCFSYPTGPVRGPCGTHKGAVRQPYGHVRELTQPELAKLPHGRHIWPYGARTGPLRPPQGLFTGCLESLNPYPRTGLKILNSPWTAYNACIKTLRAPYGEAKFVRRRTGPVRAPWVDVRFLFKTAREQPVRGPGVWCDWGITSVSSSGNGCQVDKYKSLNMKFYNNGMEGWSLDMRTPWYRW